MFNFFSAKLIEFQDLIKVGMGGNAVLEMLDSVDIGELIIELSQEVEQAKGQRKKKIMKRLRILENMLKAGIKPSSFEPTRT